MDCNICGGQLGTDAYTNPRNDDMFCSNCINDGDVTLACDRCNHSYAQDDVGYEEDADLYLCYMCQEDTVFGHINRTPHVNYKPFDPFSTEFLSDDKGDVIKSDRTFGVEFELINSDKKAILELSNSISNAFGFERDTSIVGENPIEVVTPILKGKKGEELIRDLCKNLNDREFETNDSTGLHVHLGNEGFSLDKEIKWYTVRDIRDGLSVANKPKMDEDERMIVSSKVINMVEKAHRIQGLDYIIEFVLERAHRRAFYDESLAKRLGLSEDTNLVLTDILLKVNGKNKPFRYLCAPTKKLHEEKNKERRERVDKLELILDQYDDGPYALTITDNAKKHLMKEFGTDSLDDIQKLWFEPSDDSLLCSIGKNNNLNNLKTLLYLHSAYSDFFYSMLPSNRRNNKQCQAINLSLSPKDIERISSRDELEALWYKSESLQETNHRKTGTKYDESRYYGLNLHRLFQNNTIELRYHSGSTDSESILHWIALNQHILDSITRGDVQIHNLVEGAGIFDRQEKVDFLMDRLNLPDRLRKYVRARIKHFN